jgi:uncharacterized protein YbcV (DUF1398 family)
LDQTLIQQVSNATLAGTMSFPEVVGHLLKAGIDFYYVDYLTRQKTFYHHTDESVTTTIHYVDLPSVPAQLDKVNLKAIILDSQVNHQTYEAFTRRAMQAGTVGYFAFLTGRRVVYWGRDGESHIEYFPD